MGQIVITRSALDTLPSQDVHAALRRHAAGDWGDLDEHDWQANELALADGSRLFSAYYAQDKKFWIITEADRSATTVLLPEDY
ncbi:MAG: SH3 domain-containing protein [Pirellulaceae bacterium]